MDNLINKNLIIVVGIVFIYIKYILPLLYKYTENMSNVEQGLRKLDTNMCSKDCCNHTQWPYPHDTRTKEMKEKYVGSNFSCENGCLCVKQNDLTNISLRGNNTPSMCS